MSAGAASSAGSTGEVSTSKASIHGQQKGSCRGKIRAKGQSWVPGDRFAYSGSQTASQAAQTLGSALRGVFLGGHRAGGPGAGLSPEPRDSSSELGSGWL